MSGSSIGFGEEIKKFIKKCGIYVWLSGALIVFYFLGSSAIQVSYEKGEYPEEREETSFNVLKRLWGIGSLCTILFPTTLVESLQRAFNGSS